MPPFQTMAWVSEPARDHWHPVFQRINAALIESTLTAVAKGLWEVSDIRVPGALVLQIPAAADDNGLTYEKRFVGDPEAKGPVFHDVTLRRMGEDGRGTGQPIPPCCQNRATQQLEKDTVESTWDSALATSEERHDDQTILIPSGYAFPAMFHKLLVNPFNRPLCRLDCPTLRNDLDTHLDWMSRTGFSDEADQIRDLSHWPLEWSALHGIAEVRAPVFKIAYHTDATAQRMRVRAKGTGWPLHGAQGLDFPYRMRTRRKITESRGFVRGLKHGSRT